MFRRVANGAGLLQCSAVRFVTASAGAAAAVLVMSFICVAARAGFLGRGVMG